MRLALIAALVSTSCTDSSSGGGGPDINSFVDTYDFSRTIPPRLDVLIVLDDTTAMAAYQTALAGFPAGAAAALDDPDSTLADTRIALTTTAATGTFRQVSVTSEPFLAISYNAHLERQPAFTGTLADALAQLIAVGATSSVAAQPLEAAKAALDANPTFLRGGADLGIVTITASDDASAGAVADYVVGLKARTSDPTNVVLSGIYPAGAPRLDAFHSMFPNRAEVTDIATTDFSTPLGDIPYLLRTVLGYRCYREPADVDPNTPGSQYDCDLNAYYEDGTTEPVRQCSPDRTGPCFEFIPDPGCMSTFGETARAYLRGFPTQYSPNVRGQCVVAEGGA